MILFFSPSDFIYAVGVLSPGACMGAAVMNAILIFALEPAEIALLELPLFFSLNGFVYAMIILPPAKCMGAAFFHAIFKIRFGDRRDSLD